MVENGKIGIVPGGHAEYRPAELIKNPASVVVQECLEELGELERGSLYSLEKHPIGVFRNKDTAGINIFYKLKIFAGKDDVTKSWQEAKDRGEHSRLMVLTSKEVSQLGERGGFKRDNLSYETTPFFQDCFKYYTCFAKK